jgi:hypothetical protein
MKELNKTYRMGLVIMTAIIFLPFINYVHLLFSSTSNTISIFSFSFSHDLIYNQLWAWSLVNYLVQLLFLIIIFYSTESFYKFLLLPLIALYILTIATILGFIPSIYSTPISLEIILISIILIFIIFALDRKNTHKYQTIVNNRIITELIVNRFNSSLKKAINRALRLKEERLIESPYHYLRKAVYLKSALKQNYELLLAYKNVKQKKSTLYKKISICMLISLIYIFWFLPFLIPEEIKSIDIIGIQINSFGFKDVSLFLWFISRKLIIILVLFVWFITSQHWWRYAILSPLILYSYQFWEAFQDVSELDSTGNLRVFPLVLLNLVVVVSLSRLVRYRAKFMVAYDEISREIDDILEEMKMDYPKEVTATLQQIRNFKAKGAKEKYRKRLRDLENEILSRLEPDKG